VGKYEDQLKALGTSDAVFRIEGITALETQMGKLKSDMATLAADPGWTGASAEAAKDLFTSLQAEFADAEGKLSTVRSALGDANGHRADAANAQSSLPDATVPDWVHTAAVIGGSVLIPVPGIGSFAANTVVEKVNEYLELQREAAAFQELEDFKNKLEGPKQEIKSAPLADAFGTKAPDWPEDQPTPDWPGEGVTYHGDDTGAGGWSTNGGGGGKGGGGGGEVTGVFHENPPTVIGRPPHIIHNPPPYPPIMLPPECPPGWPHNVVGTPPTVSIDGDSGGGSNPGGLLGGGSGGLGLGLAGAGAAGLGAAKLASKGGFGGGGLFGPNGLLGGGPNGAGGASGSGGAAGTKAGAAGGAGAGAGAKGGNSAMMGGGQGGGSSDREKRTSLGLMAPKLEDDEENGPRSSAAGAGGRE